MIPGHSRPGSCRAISLAALCGLMHFAPSLTALADGSGEPPSIEQRVQALLGQMTLTEKIGQMNLVHAGDADSADVFAKPLRAGRIGAVLNQVDVDVVNELQRIAVEESRLGIPLLVGRDVIHGFTTIMPIPLGQAATWNIELVREGARVAALEAAATGVNWTFAPMLDVSRDARWGRIAESLGEDPYLTSVLGVAMVEGFQGDDLTLKGTIAACAKHFAAYGASESGRDYDTVSVSESELRNVYLPPFKAAVEAGAMSVMASFSEVNGVPATANEFLLREVLRDEWDFAGLMVSDWGSIYQLSIHGLTENDKEAALAAATAGIDMEMSGVIFANHLAALVDEQRIAMARIDAMVANILRTKFKLGLFENPYTNPEDFPPIANEHALATARTAALQSVVMLKNENAVLPLSVDKLGAIAVIGPLADAPYEQLGTWVFDGDPALSITGLRGIRDLVGSKLAVHYVRAMETSRSRATAPFAEAVAAARKADAVILFLGEESILSGEAHSRADISLPGAQADLVRRVRQTGKPVIAVILAGRPLTLTDIIDDVDAILYAWHPGTMGGPAIADLLFGIESPSGKLPVTFPNMVGQIPIYYNRKNTGKPPSPDTVVHIDDIDVRAPQTSFGMTAFHLDAGYQPLFAFGHGLSYSQFEYQQLQISSSEIRLGESFFISAEVANKGGLVAEEVVQLYVRDLVGSVTRPVRELKGFKRIRLEPGQSRTVRFDLHTSDLAFYGRDMRFKTEPGLFHAWVGGSSEAELRSQFRVVE